MILRMDHDFPLHRSPICFGILEKSLLPFSVKPGELPLHDTNSHFEICLRPFPTSLYGYRSQMSSHGWRLESFHLKSTQSGSWAYWYMTPSM